MQTHPYPTDLTDEEWNQIQSLVPKPKSGKGKRGRRLELDRRTLLNAICYEVRSGCAWRLLPKDFGPWQTVYGYFRQWSGVERREVCVQRDKRSGWAAIPDLDDDERGVGAGGMDPGVDERVCGGRELQLHEHARGEAGVGLLAGLAVSGGRQFKLVARGCSRASPLYYVLQT